LDVRDTDRLPDALVTTRRTMHRIAAHVLGRRRYAVTSRFGLRASPGGIATPPFGDGPETIRMTGASLVHETGSRAAYLQIAGSTLAELAAFACADLHQEFSAGPETPELGDVDEPLDFDTEAATVLAGWYDLGWRSLDYVIARQPVDAAPAPIELWPEHFDAGTNVGLASGSRIGVGASPGDLFSEEPYLYVNSPGAERRGDPAFWNAPFGAILPWTHLDLHGEHPPVQAAAQFLLTGLSNASARAAP
jgi:hypothetical protein